jgi:hypothetical protein
MMATFDDRRNPYLVLGLPYGSSISDVRKAFSRRSREVARGSLSELTEADLTWALSQLEQGASDPAIEVSIYRVPANLSLFDSKPTGSDAVGFLNPRAEPILRTTDPATSEHIDELTDKALIEWVAILLSAEGMEIRIPYPTPE